MSLQHKSLSSAKAAVDGEFFSALCGGHMTENQRGGRVEPWLAEKLYTVTFMQVGTPIITTGKILLHHA